MAISRALGFEDLGSALDAMREGIQVIAHDWRYIYLNNAAAAHGRRPREELVGCTMMECYPGIDETEMFALLRKCMNERVSGTMENVFTYPEGGSRTFELRIEPADAGIVVLSIDVTEMRKREAKIRRLVEANIIGIFIWDVDGNILEANDEFLRLVGYDRDDLISGRVRWTDLTPPEWRERDERALAEFRATGTAQAYEKEYVKMDGSRVPVMIGGASLEPSVKEGVAFVLDLTERKRAEAALRESELRYRNIEVDLAHANRIAALGQLTASIAHEVNQPITGALSSGQAALRWLDKCDPEAARRAMERVVRDATRAGGVINGLRALVNKALPRTESFNMNDAIREVIVIAHAEATKHGIGIVAQLADGLPFVQGDRVQLQQVVLNLIINAIEALRDVGEGPRELVIRTAKSAEDFVSVAVQDTGPGIVPEDTERAFEPFYTTKPDGTGIGLSICRSIVEVHGGRLAVTANVPRGAVFQFTVNARPEERNEP